MKPTASDHFALEEDPFELSKALCSLNPDSELALQAQGRGTPQKINNDEDEVSQKDIAKIIYNSSSSEPVQKIASLPPINFRNCCVGVMNGLVVHTVSYV